MKQVISMKKYEISKEEYEAIKEREKATRDKKVSERLKVLMLIYEGYKVSEITRITGRNKSGIYRLYNRYREQGLENMCATSTHPTGEFYLKQRRRRY